MRSSGGSEESETSGSWVDRLEEASHASNSYCLASSSLLTYPSSQSCSTCTHSLSL